MANVQQNYNVGESFNTLTQDQLSALDSSWKWDHRTLSGFKTANGDFIEPGGLTSFDTQTAQVSGVWDLDKTVSVKLYLNGPAESISVNYHEENRQFPLGKGEWDIPLGEDKPWINNYTWNSTSSYITYYGTYISVDITTKDEINIKGVSATIRYNNGSFGLADLGKNVRNITFQGFYGDYQVTPSCPLCIIIDFTNQGVLTYYSNTNTINPDLA